MNINSDHVFKVHHLCFPGGRRCWVVGVQEDGQAMEVQFTDLTTAIVRHQDLLGPVPASEAEEFFANLKDHRRAAVAKLADTYPGIPRLIC
jgi:hypothetical protein